MTVSTPQSPDTANPALNTDSGAAAASEAARRAPAELAAPPEAASGGLMLIGVGEALGRLVATVRAADAVHTLRIQGAAEGAGVFEMPCPSPAEVLDHCPFLEELGLNVESFNLELRACAKALYLIYRARLLDRLRQEIGDGTVSTFVLVCEAASSLGATLMSELPADLEALFARRFSTAPIILRVPIFPVGSGQDLERATLYAMARELDAHLRGPAPDGPEPACEDPHDSLVLSDFQIGTPSQRRNEVVRFLGSVAGMFRSPSGLPPGENPIVRHRLNGPWRRGYRDLVALWRGGSWTDFRRRRLVKELEVEGRPPPLVDQEPFRAGRRLYLEMDVRYRRLLAAAPYDYPGRISPDDAWSYAELGEQLLAQGRDRDAFDSFAAAAEARADLPECFEGMGRAALLLGDSEEAMKDFTRTVQLAPDRSSAHEGIILCYLSMGRPELAKKHLELAAASGCVIDAKLAGRLQ